MAQQQILPIVIKLKEKIDNLFVNYMGPVGVDICADQWKELLDAGRVRPTSLIKYKDLLALQIPNSSQQKAFAKDVNAVLKFT
ncbi:MAG: hypothetical protein HRU38_05180 [Saccharospirillaceae bacterium]|nr:hypothetical protein [Pseudomonadales bacterium]NRB78050.1 hypothetical protein [Saccharospirillaceae bacterium]